MQGSSPQFQIVCYELFLFTPYPLKRGNCEKNIILKKGVKSIVNNDMNSLPPWVRVKKHLLKSTVNINIKSPFQGAGGKPNEL